MLYNACVVTVLLYGAECWPILRKDEIRLDAFHHQCLRSILNVSRWDQQLSHITNSDLRQRWGDVDLLFANAVFNGLDTFARMTPDRIPQKFLFGWLPQTRPAHGPCLRKDRVNDDLRKLHVGNWFKLAQDRKA